VRRIASLATVIVRYAEGSRYALLPRFTRTVPASTVVRMEIVEPARVEKRSAIPYVGIRVVTPFRGMLSVRNQLLAEVRDEVKEAEIETVGYGFLRLHVIDMDGPMDLEAGYFTAEPVDLAHPRLKSGSMAAGSYATMKYRDHARRANQALQDWVRENGLALDRRTAPEGDAFACRYEAFWTDPAVEPRKTRWTVELSILLAT
jgi:effector-binding domain-containing protein